MELVRDRQDTQDELIEHSKKSRYKRFLDNIVNSDVKDRVQPRENTVELILAFAAKEEVLESDASITTFPTGGAKGNEERASTKAIGGESIYQYLQLEG